MNDTITGFILKQTDYRESAVILSVLTENVGKISLIASGARKMTSKNAGSILPYTKAEFHLDYRDDRTMFRMKTATSKAVYRFMHEDLEASLAAGILSETADALTYEDSDPEISKSLYQLLERGFDLLNEKKRADLVTAVFLGQALTVSGLGINVDGCAVCGSTKVTAISVKDGGFLCADCASKIGIPSQKVETLRQFRLLNKATFDQFEILESCCSNAMRDIRDQVLILQEHAGIRVHSFALYQRLFAIE